MGSRRTRLAVVAALFAGLVAVGDTSVHATFSGSNGRVALTSSETGCLMLANADGTVREPLADLCGFAPDWSPDGSKLAFIGFLDNRTNVYTAAADGTGLTRVTNTTEFDDSPSWSPSGQQIAFAEYGGITPQIFKVNSDGSSRTQLTNSASGAASPAWAPNTTTIAFLREGNVFFVNNDGTGESQRTNFSGNERVISMDWKPDGTQLVIEKTRSASDLVTDIYIINQDGTGLSNVTNNGASNDRDPVWSPDSSKIMFVSERDGNSQIYTISPNGTALTRITNNLFSDNEPDWGTRAAAGAPMPVFDPGIFHALQPARILDTRNGTGGFATPIPGEGSIDVQVGGQGGVPSSGVTGVVINVTITQPTAGPGFLTVWPTGTTRPTVSTLNFKPGDVVANNATMTLPANGKLSVFNGSQGTIHVIFDVTGYYT